MMGTVRRSRTRLKLGCALAVLLAVGGCGGGGGGGGGGVISAPPPAPAATPTPAPAPAPTPSPSPSPTPTPSVSTASFDTAEFRRSDGPAFHNAATAWSQGATGQGVKIAVIDTGIDTDSPEFAGRIDPASADVAGNGTVEAVDGHGTQVAMVAAAARNNTGIMGIAYNATVIALRADMPGSCANASGADSDGCVFVDRDIAAGIDRAVGAGATVINLSLGGDAPNSTLIAAVKRAVAAGAVVVVSAGNEGDGSDPAIDPNQPNPFASGVRIAGGGSVIIAGSVNEQGQISAFSNRAGAQATWYLSALGERVCCVYENGVLQVENTPSGNYVTLVSGTSFAAPQIAGAVALLKQAFPNLSGAQMVDILLASARDAGSAGTDAVYGRGILDIAAAFAPRGTMTLAGGTASVGLMDDIAIGSSAMGDAFAGTSAQAVVLDQYGRAYSTDVGRRMQGASVSPRLLTAIENGSRQVGGGTDALNLAFSLANGTRGLPAWPAQLRLSRQDAEAAKVLAARAALKIAPGQQLGIAFRERAGALVAQLQGQERPAFMIADEAMGEAGFAESANASLAYRHEFGAWGLTAGAQNGQAVLGALRVSDGTLDRRRERLGLSSYSLTADRRFGALDAALGVTWMNEQRTALGGYWHDGLGGAGARTVFADASAGWNLAPGWRLGGAFRQGWTRADRGGASVVKADFVSRAWSVDLVKQGVLGQFDTLGLRVSQPLRVEGGAFGVTLPVSYDYATLTPTYASRFFSLSPSGREIDGEIAWTGRLFGGDAAASLYYRKDPGHIASLPDEKGAAVKWSRRF